MRSELKHEETSEANDAAPEDDAIGIATVKLFDEDVGYDIGEREEKEAAVEDERADLPDGNGADI